MTEHERDHMCPLADEASDAAAKALQQATDDAADALLGLMEDAPLPKLSGPYQRAYDTAQNAIDVLNAAYDTRDASYVAHTDAYQKAGYIT